MFRLIKLEDRIVLDGNDIDIWNNSSPTVLVSDPLPGMEIVSPLPLPNQGKTPIFPLAAGKILDYDISRHIVDYDKDPITYAFTDVEALDGGSEDWLKNNVSIKGSHLMIDASAPMSEVSKSYAIHFTADDEVGNHTPMSFTFKFKVETNTKPLVDTEENPLPALLIPAGKPFEYDVSPYIINTEKDPLIYSYTDGIALESGSTKWYEQGEFQGGRLKILGSPSPDDEYRNFILNFTVSDTDASGNITLNTSSFSLRVQVVPNAPPEENPDNPPPTLHLKQGAAGGTDDLSRYITDTDTDKDNLRYALSDIRDENNNILLWNDKISIDEKGNLTISNLKDAEVGKTYQINFTVSDGINLPEKFFISVQIDPNSPPYESKSEPLPTAEYPLLLKYGQYLNEDMNKYFTDDDNDTLTYSQLNIEALDGGSTDWYADGVAGFSGSKLVTLKAPLPTDENKTYKVDFKVADAYHSISSSMIIRIAPNSPPTLETPLPGDGTDALSLFKGQSGSYPLANHFSDPDGDLVKFVFNQQKIIAVDGGSTKWFDSASFDEKGNLKIPAPGTSEAGKHYVINFLVTDGINIDPDKEGDIKSYSIPIKIPNRAPMFRDETFPLIIQQNIQSGTLLGKVSNFVSDEDGDTLKYSIVGGDTDQRFEINSDTGELKIVNIEQLEAGDHFELKILAKENKVPGLSAEATIVVDVKEKINQIPRENSVNPKPLPIIWDTGQLLFEYDLSAHYTDPDTEDKLAFENAETLAITPFKTDKSWNFTLSEDGRLTATLPEGQTEGDYIVRFNVNDGNGGVITDAIEIRFKQENNDPVVYDQIFSVREAAYARMPVGIVLASDSDGDTLSYSIVPESDPDGIFSIDSSGMIRVIKPELLDSQKTPQIVLTVRVEDVLHASVEATVTVNVEKSLKVLQPQKDNAATDQNNPVPIDVVGNDGQDNLIVVSAEGKEGVSKGSVTLQSDNRILYDPGSGFQTLAEGEIRYDVFTYTVSDGIQTAKAPVSVRIMGLNDLPTFSGIGQVYDISDTDKIALLAGFTISDIDVYNDGSKDIQSMTIWIDHPENGQIFLSGGFVTNSDGSFTITGTAETVQQALRNIVFEPVPSDLPFEIKETKFRAEIGNHDHILAIDNLAAISAGSTISPSEAYSAEKVWIGTEIMIPYYGVSWKDTSSELLGLSIEHGLPVFTLKNLKLDEFDFGLPDETENIYELVNRMLREAKLFTDIDETMYPQKYSQEITDANRNTENWRIDIHPLEVR